MKIKDAFTTLGLPETSSESDVKHAYRYLVKKSHPDVNPDASARKEFEIIQQAYELIQAYFEYCNSPDFQKETVKIRRKTRVRNIIKQKEARREFLYAKLLYDIAVFKNTKKFFISQIIAVCGFLLSVFILLDYFAFSESHYEPIQGITTSNSFQQMKYSYFDNIYLFIQNRKVSISTSNVAELSNMEYVKVTNTKWFHQITQISFTKNARQQFVEFYNFYNDAIILIALLLLGGMSIYIYSKKNMLYFFIIKYYNFYVIPLLIIFVLLGEARIFRLFRII